MRNIYMKQVRSDWSTSKFFLGRNKVMAKALGISVEDEYRTNLSDLSKKLVGDVGLLFTNEPVEKAIEYFGAYSQTDYARGGGKATSTITLPEGDLYRGEERIPHNMEAHLRALGMPTALSNGIVVLRSEYTICKEGDVLTPEQAQLLKTFYIQMADFSIDLVSYWHNGQLLDL